MATTSRPYAANSHPNVAHRHLHPTPQTTRRQTTPTDASLGLRWIVEATNSWWSNYGQLRRNTDRKTRHRHAALCLATTILTVGKLITYRDRWSAN